MNTERYHYMEQRVSYSPPSEFDPEDGTSFYTTCWYVDRLGRKVTADDFDTLLDIARRDVLTTPHTTVHADDEYGRSHTCGTLAEVDAVCPDHLRCLICDDPSHVTHDCPHDTTDHGTTES